MIRPTEKDDLLKWIIDLRRHFHKYPELSFEEFNTQKKIMSVLDSLGIENKKIADTGVLGIIYGANSGKTIAVRADMDALKIDEAKTELNESYISKTGGTMHACGHDGHLAMLLGAAKKLKGSEKNLRGRVKLIFQPAEEVPPGGALKVIDEEILNDVDSIVGMHLFNNIDSGKVCLKEGTLMASHCKYDVVITGKPGHHYNPEACIDPIQIASKFVTTIQSDLKNNLPPVVGYVFGFGTICGGQQFNQTPSEVKISGSYRILDNKARLEVIEKTIRKNLDGLMLSHKKENSDVLPRYKLNVTRGYPALVNSAKFTRRSAKILKKSFEDVTEGIEPVLAAEDFARYLEVVPGTYIFMGSRNQQKEIVHGNHSNKFDIDEDVLVKGTEIFYRIASDFLNTPDKYI